MKIYEDKMALSRENHLGFSRFAALLFLGILIGIVMSQGKIFSFFNFGSNKTQEECPCHLQEVRVERPADLREQMEQVVKELNIQFAAIKDGGDYIWPCSFPFRNEHRQVFTCSIEFYGSENIYLNLVYHSHYFENAFGLPFVRSGSAFMSYIFSENQASFSDLANPQTSRYFYSLPIEDQKPTS